MTRDIAACALAFVMSALLLGAADDWRASQAPVPVREEPMHHLLFENQDVRAFDVIVPPGGATLFHVHALDYVYVVLGDASLKSEIQGQPPADLPVKRGEVRFTPGPVTHRVVNVGTTPFHNITVELVRPRPSAPAALSPLPARSPGTVVLENDRLRVTRLTLRPGQTIPALALPGRTLLIAVTAGRLRTASRIRELEVGTAVWHDEPVTEAASNAGQTALEMVGVVVKE